MVSGYPDPAVVPAATDSALLLAIAVFSFVGQICLNRGFQLEVAAKASAVNYTQASSIQHTEIISLVVNGIHM